MPTSMDLVKQQLLDFLAKGARADALKGVSSKITIAEDLVTVAVVLYDAIGRDETQRIFAELKIATPFELAKEKLLDILGEDDTEAFLKELSLKTVIAEDLIPDALIMYDAFGPVMTHQIFTLLDLNVPNVEERIHERGFKELDSFRFNHWIHHFSAHSPLSRIEMGVSRVELYPIEADIGQRLLAGMVATMWNPQNHKYFDVYKSLAPNIKDDELAHTVSVSLEKDAPNVGHPHPITDGGYHARYDYHWDFPGLMAMQSILFMVYRFIDGDDHEAKRKFQHEITECINSYSKFIAEMLALLLPNAAYATDNPVLAKVEKLVSLLIAIKERGIYNVDIASYEVVNFSPNELKELSFLMPEKGQSVMSMLTIFLFDLKTYKENVVKLDMKKAANEPMVGLPNEQSTASNAFKLACCLNRDVSLEVLTEQEIINKLAILNASTDQNDKLAASLVRQALRMRELYRIAGKSDVADIDFKLTQSPPMVSEDKRDTTQPGSVPNKSGPSRRDRRAVELFLRPAITVRPEGEQGRVDSFFDIAPKYWANINAAVVHRTGTNDRELMTTPDVLAVFKPDSTINFSYIFNKLGRIKSPKVPAITPVPDETPIEIALIKADWFDAKTKPASAGADANVFGHLGTLEVSEDIAHLKIPLQNAGEVSRAFLEHFGATLIPVDKDIPYHDKRKVDLICAEYDFNEKYIPDYALQIQKGGGIFVETHEFRQFFTPLEKTAKGGIILGKKRDDGFFEFTALEIPFGYTLVIEPNVIHGDSFFKGRYAIALTEVVSADSVLIRTKSGDILPVSQVETIEEALPTLDVETLRNAQVFEPDKQGEMATYNPQRFFSSTHPVSAVSETIPKPVDFSKS